MKKELLRQAIRDISNAALSCGEPLLASMLLGVAGANAAGSELEQKMANVIANEAKSQLSFLMSVRDAEVKQSKNPQDN